MQRSARPRFARTCWHTSLKGIWERVHSARVALPGRATPSAFSSAGTRSISVPDAIEHRSVLAATPPREGWRWNIAVLLGYLAATIVFTWPLVLHWQTGVIQHGSAPVDGGQNIWGLWWIRHAILHGQNPYVTSYLFFPDEINLFWQTFSLPNALLVLPVLIASGPIVAFNLLVLLAFGLSGFLVYKVARALLDNRVAALFAGFIYAFAPYHMQPLLGGALEIVAVQWIPLYVLLLMAMLSRPSAWRVVAAAVALVITTLSSHYYGLFCVVYTILHVGIALLLVPDRRYWLAVTVGAAGIAIIWIAALVPFAWPVNVLHTNVPGDWYSRQVYHSVALVDLAALNIQHPLWGDYARQWLQTLHPFGVEIGVSPGVVVYALVLYGCVCSWKKTWPWLLLALLLLVLSLGPELKIDGRPTDIPLPFKLLDTLSPFRNSSRPSRFVAVMMAPVSVLAGFGVQDVWRRSGRYALRVVAGVGVVLLCELAVAPWPILPIRVDPLYARLHYEPDLGGVLELPPRNDDSQYMMNQMCHSRPLAGGYLARTPDYSLAAHDSTVRQLWYAEQPTPDVFGADLADELAALGIRFVVLNTADLSSSELARLRAHLDIPRIVPYGQNARVEIYKVVGDRVGPLILPLDGWYAAETDGRRTWRWMRETSELRVVAPQDAVVSLTLDLTAYQSPRPLEIWLDGRRLRHVVVPSAPLERSLRLVLILRAGEHRVTLRSTAEPALDGRHISISALRAQIERASPIGADVRNTLPPDNMPTIMPALKTTLCAESAAASYHERTEP
ncbi:MAG: hypothetical protein MI924_14515 [Chloroflexales bacterium]|nr:hypothetical protein [Chloroflexales bacterium]